MSIDKNNIARFIDHTNLRADASGDELGRLCSEAKEYGFYSVCVHPSFVNKAKELLAGSEVKISAVIGFPLGMTLPGVKIYEAMESVFNGADELDIVMNVGLAKSKQWETLAEEVASIITATPGTLHKIIIETCYLTDEEKKKALAVVLHGGAEFIKTSTGFGPAGADVRDVELLHAEAKGNIAIKAAGGIKTLGEVLAFTRAGATRIGTSSGVNIMKELE